MVSILRYFLPEDGDNEDTPNVFLAPKPSRPGYPPLLRQVKGSFPLPGSYHFRFKSPLVPGMDREKSAVAVWMDCVDDSEPVPLWQNSIIAKVSRISLGDDEDDEDFAGEGFTRAESNLSIASGNSAPPKTVTEPYSTVAVNSSADDSLLGAFDEPLAPAPTAASVASSTHSSANNLLDVDNHPPAQTSGGGLLDMDHLGSAGGYRSSGANTPTSEHHDLLNMMSAPMPTQPRPTLPTQGGAMPAQQRQQPIQQGRPPQQMGGQYPMQYTPQGQYAAQGMSHMPAPPQQRNMQNSATVNKNGNKNAFDKFSGSSLDPLGGLNWNMK